MADSLTMIDKLKVMLGLADDDQRPVLDLIIDQTEAALNFKLGTTAIPAELEWIELEVCVSRYNRLKNEGMTAYTQEGESITFKSSDFDDFLDDINDWRRRNQKDPTTLGQVLFLNPYPRGDRHADD